MCGRFTLHSSPEAIAEAFDLAEIPHLSPHYNIAPSQAVAAVRLQPATAARELVLLRWGLIPFWADDPSIGNRMLNARSETADSKPSFRRPFRSQRCLIVADGFFEWQKTDGTKQPFYIRLRSERPFGFAGLWERWDKHGTPIESCTILTTEPNDLMSPIHDRMPVIVSPEHYAAWLDPTRKEGLHLRDLLRPYSAEEMIAYPIATLVNNPRNDLPACIEPISQGDDPTNGAT